MAGRQASREARYQRIRAELDARRLPFAVLIENFKHDTNVGGVVRTAHSALASEIVVVGSPDWNRSYAVSADRWEHIRYFARPEEALAYVRERGYRVVVTEQHRAAVSLFDAAYPERPVFVFGHELQGVSPVFLRHADLIVQIPQWGLVGSLNVGASAAVVIYDWLAKHRDILPPPRVAVERATGRPKGA